MHLKYFNKDRFHNRFSNILQHCQNLRFLGAKAPLGLAHVKKRGDGKVSE